MALVTELLSAGLIEKDSNNDVLWTWSYPSVSSVIRQCMLKKCGLQNSRQYPVSFCYCHHHGSWFFLHLTEVFDLDKLPGVKQFVLILQTRDFHPDKYEILCRIMSKTYCKTGSPAAMLQLYLSVLVKGSCSTKENGSFYVGDFDLKSSLLKAPIKGVIKLFGLESILIYTALILKKRIVVYHHHLDSLLAFLRVIPAFIWHRQNWDILYPYMQLSEYESSELLSLQTYVAGYIDAAVEARNDLYDVFVNVAATEITISPRSKEIFAMTKTHKDIAVFMTQAAENPELNDQQVIKEITMKTQELINSLKSLCSKNKAGVPVLSLSALKENKFAPALENFLWNLALAEGLIEI